MKEYFGNELDTTIFCFVAILTIPFIILGAFWPEGLARVCSSSVGDSMLGQYTQSLAW